MIAVSILDDAHDPRRGDASRCTCAAQSARRWRMRKRRGRSPTATPCQRAWLRQFGRTPWDRVLGALDERLISARVSRTQARIGGTEHCRGKAICRSAHGEEQPNCGAGDLDALAGTTLRNRRALSGRVSCLRAATFQVTTA